MWGHCMMHYESLAMKELCPEMSEVMDTAIKTVNYIKTRTLKSRFFAELCKELGDSISHSCFTAFSLAVVMFAICKE
jgi:hypothetical protein